MDRATHMEAPMQSCENTNVIPEYDEQPRIDEAVWFTDVRPEYDEQPRIDAVVWFTDEGVRCPDGWVTDEGGKG